MNSSPKSKRPAVEIPRGVLVALVTALFASVVAVAFLVGRSTGRGREPAPAPMTTMATTPAPPAAGSPPGPAADTPHPSFPAVEGQLPVAPSAPPSAVAAWPSAAPFAPAAAGGEELRDQVATYFREVEAIQSQGQSSGAGDPETFAKALLEQGANGDMSGFDALARANQKVRDGLAAVAVPEPCREHHRQTMALIQESIAMLGRVKEKIQSGDVNSLAALPAEGYALERKAKEVDALAAEIKRRFSS